VYYDQHDMTACRS